MSLRDEAIKAMRDAVADEAAVDEASPEALQFLQEDVTAALDGLLGWLRGFGYARDPGPLHGYGVTSECRDALCDLLSEEER